MAQALPLDPCNGADFWEALRRLPGYPHGDVIRLRRMIFGSNALEKLPAVLEEVGAASDRPLHVVMDETPMRRAGEDLKLLVLARLRQAGWSPEAVVVSPDGTGQVRTDLDNIGRVQARLSSGGSVVAVGSGTITDIAKHACYQFEQALGSEIPFVVFQTANSVSAYTSNMAPALMNGVKRTLPSRYPDGLVCDLETLRDAPGGMTAAGVGDLLAAAVSFADWYLAHSLGLDESYTPLAETLMGPLESTLIDLASQLRLQDLEAMGLLAKLIALAGLAMSLSHATTPLSGHEHVISHVLDMQAEAADRPLAMHGAQVALAATRMASVYRGFLEEFEPASRRWEATFPDSTSSRSQIAEAFAPVDPAGRTVEECWRDYSIKLEAWRGRESALTAWLTDWPMIRSELARRVWEPRALQRILRAVGLPETFEALDPPVAEARARQAFLSAHWIRRRFTVGDLLFFLGWDREGLWDRAAGTAF